MRRRREGREGEEPGRHEPVGAVDEEGDAVVVHEVGDEEGAGQDFVQVEQPAGVLDLDGKGRRKGGKIRVGLEKGDIGGRRREGGRKKVASEGEAEKTRGRGEEALAVCRLAGRPRSSVQ